MHGRSQSCNRNAPLLEEPVQLGAVVDGVHDDVFEVVAGEGLRDQGALAQSLREFFTVGEI